MAEVDNNIHRWVGDRKPWTSDQVRAQFRAIADLRWRIFRNSLRRKGGTGELVGTILMVPLFLTIIIGPSLGIGFLAGLFVHKGHFQYLVILLWAIFLLSQITSIQLGQAGTTFDPTQLIRFPLNFPRYAAIRVFFGLLSPANAVSTLMSLTMAIGITVVEPRIWLYVFVTMGAYGLVNIFFTRMLQFHLGRPLAFDPPRPRSLYRAHFHLRHGRPVPELHLQPRPEPRPQAGAKRRPPGCRQRLLSPPRVFLRPAAAGPHRQLDPCGSTSHWTSRGFFAAEVLGVLAFTVLFFVIFATRLYKEFRGREPQRDVANAVAKTPAKKHYAAVGSGEQLPDLLLPSLHLRRGGCPRLLRSPWYWARSSFTLRRNTGIFLRAGRAFLDHGDFLRQHESTVSTRWPRPAFSASAVAYTMMGVAPLCYNSLGLEAAGIQFFFLAPIKMRDVFIAKNLMNVGLAVIEIIAVFCAITFIGRPPSASIVVSVVLWAAFTMFLSLAVGNHRSVTAPKKVDITKMAKNQTSQLSAYISIGVMLASAGVWAWQGRTSTRWPTSWISPGSCFWGRWCWPSLASSFIPTASAPWTNCLPTTAIRCRRNAVQRLRKALNKLWFLEGAWDFSPAVSAAITPRLWCRGEKVFCF